MTVEAVEEEVAVEGKDENFAKAGKDYFVLIKR